MSLWIGNQYWLQTPAHRRPRYDALGSALCAQPLHPQRATAQQERNIRYGGSMVVQFRQPFGNYRFGNYRLVRLLGKGGAAEVYLGEHIHLGTHAAIKVLHTQLT